MKQKYFPNPLYEFPDAGPMEWTNRRIVKRRELPHLKNMWSVNMLKTIKAMRQSNLIRTMVFGLFPTKKGR